MAVPVTAMLFWACRNDLDQLINMEEKPEIPVLITENFNLQYGDSSGVLFRVTGPYREIFIGENPRTVMPKGMVMEMNSNGQHHFLSADTGIFYDHSGLMEAIGNVVMVNDGGDTLKTTRLFWNENSHTIFTRELVWIISPNGRTTELLGMVSNPDSSTFLQGNQARMRVPVDE